MAKLIADEVEIAVVGRAQSEQPGDLPQGDAAINLRRCPVNLHLVIDGGINQLEEERLATNNGLIVRLHIGDHSLVGPSVCQFVPEILDVPVFITSVGSELEPDVGNTHREAGIETGSAFDGGRAKARHPADVLGNGEGIRQQLMDDRVGQGEIRERILIDLNVEIVVVGCEGFAQPVMGVEHRRDPIKAEAVHVELLHPVATVRE